MPTKSKLVYLPPAQHDFEEIVKYHITEAGTPYARKIYSTMKTTINRLRDFPLMGQTHPDPILAASGYRKLVLTKTYVAIYKLIGDTVYVYAIVNRLSAAAQVSAAVRCKTKYSMRKAVAHLGGGFLHFWR